jgi:hypothetical protein
VARSERLLRATLVPGFQGAAHQRGHTTAVRRDGVATACFDCRQAPKSLVPGLGFEPNLLGSEPSVLPIDDPGMSGALEYPSGVERAVFAHERVCSQAQLDVFHDALPRNAAGRAERFTRRGPNGSHTREDSAHELGLASGGVECERPGTLLPIGNAALAQHGRYRISESMSVGCISVNSHAEG